MVVVVIVSEVDLTKVVGVPRKYQQSIETQRDIKLGDVKRIPSNILGDVDQVPNNNTR